MSLRSLFADVLRASEMQTGVRPEANRPFNEVDMLNVLKGKQEDKLDSLFSEINSAEVRRAKAWLDDRLEKAKKRHDGELATETVTITPALAELIIAKCNRGNRSIRKGRVSGYAEEMRQGRWKLTAQGISFARDGRLNNGQHRLLGIVEAGIPIKMQVAFGEDRDVFDVTDTGGMRGGSDTLHIHGYKNTTSLAAAARLLKTVSSDTPLNIRPLKNHEIAELVQANPGLEEATTPGMRVGCKLKFSAGAAAVAFYLIAERSPHERRLNFFIDRLCDGAGLRARDPVLVLRDGLRGKDLDGGQRGSTQRAIMHIAAIILAWNKWVHGKTATVNKLRWSPDTPFPMPE